MSYSITGVTKLATAASIAATGNQTGVDISSFTGKCILVLNAAATSGAGITLDVKLQHSRDNGSTDPYTDAGFAFTQVTNSAASFQQVVRDVDDLKQFVRVVDTLGGAGTCVRSVEIIGKAA